MKRKSNYQKLVEDWEKKLLAMDIKRLEQLIPSLVRRDGCLEIKQFDRLYRVSLETGVITACDGDAASENEKLNIYTFFNYIRDDARFRGNWLPFRDLRGANVFDSAFQRGVNNAIAQSFSGHTAELRAALAALGGRDIGVGDAGFEVPSFTEIPLRLLFWDGDDEFPAQANVLFDESSVDFIHVESLVTIASELFSRLLARSGLSRVGSSFDMQ